VPLILPRTVWAQNDVDPAQCSSRQALRVLLGHGDAASISPDIFDFDGRSYRGSFQRTEDGQIVNLVDLEQYLYSVVSREMPPGWPSSALEAQAVCARTYVLQRSDPRRSYDVIPSELDQRYDGIAGETANGVAAVDKTAGEVLSFGGFSAQVAYSSCCGGHTESASDAWGNAAAPYLEGVVCTWCTASPNYRWSRSLPLEEIAERCAPQLAMLGTLQDLQIEARDASGRARTLELVTDRGNASLGGGAFRRAVGTRVLPSLLLTNVTRSPAGGSVDIDGGGLGHGVGLCQWGARGMAADGQAASDILSLYFPGTDLQNLASHR
jgi:stage II sporulation protein D